MKVGIGYSEIPDSASAGREAALAALRGAGRSDPCDMVLLFCTARHNQAALREAVAETVGQTVPIYGGGAVGVITNSVYGYAGDQVGIACLWLDGVRCDVLIDGGLPSGEEEAGFRLGERLAQLGTKEDTPVMMFYDSIHRTETGDIRMMMATWILAGLKRALGTLPDLTGAGLLGDHAANTTDQFIGDGIGKNYAIAMLFDDNIQIDTAIMHGCRPASPYYTVTKAEGPVILEINGTPAIDFIDHLLGSAVPPEQYPFFLLLGINRGPRWSEYNEDNYASRLCLGLDMARRGIVMFEADMVEGTEFQLMFRSLELDYMKPKIEALFDGLDGREPVFAMYIDCAGRCAGYGGVDMEDAVVLQEVVAGRVPVLGIYTGVEIASIAGEPRGLDWTGVFCLFSQGGKRAKKVRTAPPIAPVSPAVSDEIPMDVLLKLCEQNAAKAIALDTQSIVLRYELELKRRGFRLLSELAVSLRQMQDYGEMFVQVAQRINSALNMQKTFVLVSDEAGDFLPRVLQGFSDEEKARLTGKTISVPQELLGNDPVIINSEAPVERFADLRAEFGLPYFIAAPIAPQGGTAALLVTGRIVEQPPYCSRLGQSDLETVHAIAELLGSVLVRQRLSDVTQEAESDGLTGLLNRNTFRRQVEAYLRTDNEPAGAFMMLDIDHFKQVNDTFGHIAGDDVLVRCATAMRGILRDSDLVGRQGGDEFVIFCRGLNSLEVAEQRAQQILDAWARIVPLDGTQHISGSIGIALAPRHGRTFDALYANADAAAYRAKEAGRAQYAVFHD